MFTCTIQPTIIEEWNVLHEHFAASSLFLCPYSMHHYFSNCFSLVCFFSCLLCPYSMHHYFSICFSVSSAFFLVSCALIQCITTFQFAFLSRLLFFLSNDISVEVLNPFKFPISGTAAKNYLGGVSEPPESLA